MVRHIVIWNLKSDAPENQKLLIKEGLESLMGKIPGLIDIKVMTELLPSSNGDLMLDSTFEDYDALNGYAVHPEHMKIATFTVRPFTAKRICVDYEIKE